MYLGKWCKNPDANRSLSGVLEFGILSCILVSSEFFCLILLNSSICYLLLYSTPLVGTRKYSCSCQARDNAKFLCWGRPIPICFCSVPPFSLKRTIPFFFVIVKVIIANFSALIPKCLWGVSPHLETMALLFPLPGITPSQTQDDACEFIISCLWGEINYFPLYRLRNSLHQYSFSLACFNGLNFPPQGQCKSYIEFVGIAKPCIEERWEDCYCCNNQHINMCSSLTVTKGFCRISLHWFFIFSTFSFGRPGVIFWESSRNSRFDVGPSNDFCALFKSPKF